MGVPHTIDKPSFNHVNVMTNTAAQWKRVPRMTKMCQ